MSRDATKSISECPAGHELQPWVAPAGTCNGCGKNFPSGEQVMDCRRCDWLLCEICCPRSKAKPSFWGSLSQLPFYAAEKIDAAFDSVEAAFDSVDNAIDEFTERHASTIDRISESHTAAIAAIERIAPGASFFINPFYDENDDETVVHDSGKNCEVLAKQTEEARELIAEFCENFPDLRVMPDDEELESLWSRSSLLYACALDPGPLADAISQQLSWSGTGEVWQPRLRALRTLEYFHWKGDVGQTISLAVVLRAGGDIRCLTKVPECEMVASRVALTLLGEEGKFDGSWTYKQKPGFNVEIIKGDMLQWSDGTTSKLTPEGVNKVSTQFHGKKCHGELVGNELIWNHNNTWVQYDHLMADAPEFVLIIEKIVSGRESKLGLDISYKDGRQLLVKKVKEGLIMRWNTDNPNLAVKQGDCICAVNGIEGNCQRLVSTISVSKRLHIRIRRSQLSEVEESTKDISSETGVEGVTGKIISQTPMMDLIDLGEE